ncbi:MAG: cell envelope integrity protein CreD, partial [Proteobacteria bacterium]|nr:cell envelope integrity protein CreD [Pseudomonadota bacterium]
GIFDVLVYQAELELTCKFSSLKQYKIANKTIHWDQAKIALFVKDIKGLNKVTLKINNSDIHVQSSSTVSCFKGVHAPLTSINQNEPLNVTFSINIKGSESLSFLPIAKENKIELSSNWPDPSFTGQFLPNTKNVTKQGFDAQWAISSYATSLNESFYVEELNTKSMFDQKFGVRFLKTADHYQQAERTSKYSFLFVLYTFLLFFLYEVVKKTKIHIFQYFITACSLLCFSVLLTAVAEHAPFEVAYGVSALAIISQISFYAFGVLHKKSERITFVSLLISIYLYLFIVLRLEEIAFLIGAIGMFLAITAAMYCTKNIKWFEREV